MVSDEMASKPECLDAVCSMKQKLLDCTGRSVILFSAPDPNGETADRGYIVMSYIVMADGEKRNGRGLPTDRARGLQRSESLDSGVACRHLPFLIGHQPPLAFAVGMLRRIVSKALGLCWAIGCQSWISSVYKGECFGSRHLCEPSARGEWETVRMPEEPVFEFQVPWPRPSVENLFGTKKASRFCGWLDRR